MTKSVTAAAVDGASPDPVAVILALAVSVVSSGSVTVLNSALYGIAGTQEHKQYCIIVFDYVARRHGRHEIIELRDCMAFTMYVRHFCLLPP